MLINPRTGWCVSMFFFSNFKKEILIYIRKIFDLIKFASNQHTLRSIVD